MLTLYLVRHGETTWNSERRMQGWSDAPLTLKGIQSAQALGRRLKDVEFKEIYTSTSGRSVHTGSIIYNAILESNSEYPSFGLQIYTDPRLREMSLGSWEGEFIKKIKTEESAAMESFYSTPASFSVEGSETLLNVQERAIDFLSNLVSTIANPSSEPSESSETSESTKSNQSNGPNNKIMVVSHTIWIKVALASIQKQSLNEIWKSTYIHPTSLTIIEIPDGLESAKVTLEGDMEHWNL
ncbi:MAG: histidine phosphatase family protein [Promethearchaeota archaeon]